MLVESRYQTANQHHVFTVPPNHAVPPLNQAILRTDTQMRSAEPLSLVST